MVEQKESVMARALKLMLKKKLASHFSLHLQKQLEEKKKLELEMQKKPEELDKMVKS